MKGDATKSDDALRPVSTNEKRFVLAHVRVGRLPDSAGGPKP